MQHKIAVGVIAAALITGSSTGLAIRAVDGDDAQSVSDTAASSVPSIGTPARTAADPTPTPAEAPDPTSTPTESTDGGDTQVANPAATRKPASSPKPDRSSKSGLLPLTSMQINTGAVGPVRVGLTKAQAAGTGYFNTDVPSQVCRYEKELEWKSGYANALDLLLSQDAKITAIGIRAAGPKTRSGLQVGSTFQAVRDVIGPEHRATRTGYGQTGLFVNDGDAWIGFLFDARPQEVKASDKVTFIEVTDGKKPSLIRDGC